MESSIGPDLECKIYKYLLDSGCCYSCCLRFLGTRTTEYFIDPIKTSLKLKYITDDDEIKNEARCISCIGILNDAVEKEAVQKVKEAIKNGGYDSSTFTFALSLPVSLTIRETSIQIALSKKFNLSELQLFNLKLKTWSVKDVWKAQVVPIIENECFIKNVTAPVPSLFSIDISFINDIDEKECNKLLQKCDPNFVESKHKHLNNKIYSRTIIEKILSSVKEENFIKYFNIPIDKPTEIIKVDKVGCSHGSIFIGGRYTKFNRQLSQTPWLINGEKKMETSVQELICALIIEHTKAESLKFLSSGREDVDVRTINSGRPFAVELINPKITNISDDDFNDLVTKINASTDMVQVTSKLRLLNNDDLKRLKEGENQKSKFYRALCLLRSNTADTIDFDKLNSIKNLEIIQKTPIRVLHRRPLASRPRFIHDIRGRLLTQEEIIKLSVNTPENVLKKLFIIDLKTQAGTYVKEFVHGDFCRTKPNLGDLINEDVDIVALDVTGINLHWP